MIEHPVAARLVGPHPVAVTALVLAVAMMRLQAGIRLAATIPHNTRILENDLPAVGRGRGADVAVPSDKRIGIDVGVLNGPVGNASGRDTGAQTVNIDVLNQDVLAVGGNDAGQSPVAVRIAGTVATGREIRARVHAARMISDLQTLDLDVVAALKAHDAGGAFGPP
jgi:hypothetical protein